jgi:hypothetical protein
VWNVAFLKGGDLLGCQLNRNRCERVIEVAELGGAPRSAIERRELLGLRFAYA